MEENIKKDFQILYEFRQFCARNHVWDKFKSNLFDAKCQDARQTIMQFPDKGNFLLSLLYFLRMRYEHVFNHKCSLKEGLRVSVSTFSWARTKEGFDFWYNFFKKWDKERSKLWE